MILLCVFLATTAMLGALLVATVVLFALTLVALATSPLMRHCVLKALSTIYHHPSHSLTAVVWIVRLVFNHIARPFRDLPNHDARITAVDEQKLPSLVSKNKIADLRAYIDSFIDTERFLVNASIDNAFRFDIRVIPDLFLDSGLINGPRAIPAGTIFAMYYATLCQRSVRDETSSYVFTYGKFPERISRLDFELDGKPRLHVNPDSNAVFVNHNCKDPNAVFEWIGIHLVLRAAVQIPPFQSITAHYGPEYLFTKSEAAHLKAKTIRCLCQAPRPCSDGMFLIAH